ncbi:LysE family translocator [Vibrio sp.]|uniref:LysE family translocator n=1 Tax=Vibrio sp. TaxID=678 RepID=UPI003D14BC58
MNEMTILATLATVHFVALMSPGPDFALVVQNASRYGRQTGLFIALGLSCGILLHALLSLTGVSYLVQTQPALFALLQLVGGGYLLYLGSGALTSSWRRWRSGSSTGPVTSSGLVLHNKRQAFSRGFTTNILNPKALVFFISLMSSLVPASMSAGGKTLALALLFGLSLLWFSLLAWFLSTQALQQRLQRLSLLIDTLCGVVFTLVGSGILLRVVMTLLG